VVAHALFVEGVPAFLDLGIVVQRVLEVAERTLPFDGAEQGGAHLLVLERGDEVLHIPIAPVRVGHFHSHEAAFFQFLGGEALVHHVAGQLQLAGVRIQPPLHLITRVSAPA
jgi:hypothetical protein